MGLVGNGNQVACEAIEHGIADGQQNIHSTALKSLFVDLCGEEDGDRRVHGEPDVAISSIAANLSPRRLDQQARVLEPSVAALNIYQPVVAELDFKQARGKGVRVAFCPIDSYGRRHLPTTLSRFFLMINGIF